MATRRTPGGDDPANGPSSTPDCWTPPQAEQAAARGDRHDSVGDGPGLRRHPWGLRPQPPLSWQASQRMARAVRRAEIDRLQGPDKATFSHLRLLRLPTRLLLFSCHGRAFLCQVMLDSPDFPGRPVVSRGVFSRPVRRLFSMARGATSSRTRTITSVTSNGGYPPKTSAATPGEGWQNPETTPGTQEPGLCSRDYQVQVVVSRCPGPFRSDGTQPL